MMGRGIEQSQYYIYVNKQIYSTKEPYLKTCVTTQVVNQTQIEDKRKQIGTKRNKNIKEE